MGSFFYSIKNLVLIIVGLIIVSQVIIHSLKIYAPPLYPVTSTTTIDAQGGFDTLYLDAGSWDWVIVINQKRYTEYDGFEKINIDLNEKGEGRGYIIYEHGHKVIFQNVEQILP